MARRVTIVCLAGFAAGLAAGCASDMEAHRKPPPNGASGGMAQPKLLWLRGYAMARPIVAWLEAVKARDADALRDALSSRVKDRLGSIDWNRLLAYYEGAWAEQLGEWRVEDFVLIGTVQREGALQTAEVTIAFAPRDGAHKTLRVDVVREGSRWRVDQFPRNFAGRGAR